MMRISRVLYFIFVLTLFSLPLKAAVYCACCAEPGQYSISVRKPGNIELEILREIKFADANLFTTPAYPDDIKGISGLTDSYTVNGNYQNKIWRFNFTDDKSKTGTLLLPMPATMVAFAADIHDREETQSNGPILYKEWRFKFKVREGTGIFQTGIAPSTDYFLVLQGRGNNCASSGDFRNWRLEVTGKKANYAFYGKIKTN